MGVIDHGFVFVSRDSGDTYLPIPVEDLPSGGVTIINLADIKKNGLINVTYDFSRGGFMLLGHSNRKFRVSPVQLTTSGQQVIDFYFTGDGYMPSWFATTHRLTVALIDGEAEVVPKLDGIFSQAPAKEPSLEHAFFTQAFAALDLQLTCSLQEALQSSVRAVRPSTGLLPRWICLFAGGGSSAVNFAGGYFNAVRTVGFLLRQAVATSEISVECLRGLVGTASAVAERRKRDCFVLGAYGSTAILNHRAAADHWDNLTRYLLHGIADAEQKNRGETRIFL